MKLLWSVDIIAMIMVFISIFITNNYEEKEEIVIDNISMCMTIKPGIEDDITIPEERHVMVQEAFDIKEIIKATPVVCKQTIVYKPPVVKEKPKVIEPTVPKIPEEDINLIALVVMAEAEAELELGKRLVIDTILNRVDSKYFPDTIYDVIYQKNQFSSMWNGRTDRCSVQQVNYDLVVEELAKRTNTEVMFFTAGNYIKYGVPMYKVGNHYFSKYE